MKMKEMRFKQKKKYFEVKLTEKQKTERALEKVKGL